MRLLWLLLLAVLACACSKSRQTAELILATTTSTQDSGLLGDLLPVYERTHDVKIKVIAVGTGEALALGARGDADVLLVHSRPAEDDFMAKGHGALRLDVMHNDFLLIGPASDPAKAKGEKAASALRRIADSASPFASRGDKSGTHKKEQDLWKAAATDPAGKPWLLSTGQGMGETARIASEKAAYTLIDRGTWLALKSTLKLEPISEGEPSLANPYGVIVVSGSRFPRVQEQAAREFAQWLVSPEAQKRIAAFGKARYGRALFVPDALKESAP